MQTVALGPAQAFSNPSKLMSFTVAEPLVGFIGSHNTTTGIFSLGALANDVACYPPLVDPTTDDGSGDGISSNDSE